MSRRMKVSFDAFGKEFVSEYDVHLDAWDRPSSFEITDTDPNPCEVFVGGDDDAEKIRKVLFLSDEAMGARIEELRGGHE